MPRIARPTEPDAIYHVTSRGNNRAAIFHDQDDFNSYLVIIRSYKKKFGFQVFHYALMPNHVHLMLRPTVMFPLSLVMKCLTQKYSWYYKKRYGYCGRLWQDRFHSEIITSDRYLLACGIYIEMNPLRAGLVGEAGDYQWSSARYYLNGQPDDLVDPDPLFLEFADDDAQRRRDYKIFFS